MTVHSRPTRTSKSMVWGGVRAENIQTKTVFRWTAEHNAQFESFLKKHGKNARTTADIDELLIKLNLDGYYGVKNKSGEDLEKIILDKVKRKLYNVSRQLPMKDRSFEAGHKDTAMPEDGATFNSSRDAASPPPPAYGNTGGIPVAHVKIPQFELTGRGSAAFKTPSRERREERLSQTGQEVVHYVDSPAAESTIQRKHRPMSAQGSVSLSAEIGAAASLQSSRRSKAQRVSEAWNKFHQILLDVDQQPDEEEDETLYGLTTSMVRASDSILGKRVASLNRLAGSP
ncbi:uncharacterized protein JN550_003095 [Neoarthrinium moseri]|uniref:uncharacterized protein n=1 Tax=Neoarthrinium moseri TaxID=1658444 RepID=UPI001FDCA208|nr:uncharacterized protein JN550_003095 [Neoarthrinium moseri]KAI1873826.1 hypothetical protein JN550_003095 [Neoarthrinium moseri]